MEITRVVAVKKSFPKTCHTWPLLQWCSETLFLMQNHGPNQKALSTNYPSQYLVWQGPSTISPPKTFSRKTWYLDTGTIYGRISVSHRNCFEKNRLIVLNREKNRTH
jgi:hypothetical protein